MSIQHSHRASLDKMMLFRKESILPSTVFPHGSAEAAQIKGSCLVERTEVKSETSLLVWVLWEAETNSQGVQDSWGVTLG